jgi:hypothetical protein
MNYNLIYEKIINYAKSQNRVKNKVNGLYENHHIIPKSIGGTNDKNNLVLLTPKEHYICHRLLVEIYKDTPFNNKMYYAMWCMINGNGNQERYSPSSKIYEKLRREIILNMSVENPKNSKSVLQYDLNGNFIKKYKSVREASKLTKIKRSNIESCGQGRNKSTGGFMWKYENQINTNTITPLNHNKVGRKPGSIPWNKGIEFAPKCFRNSKQILQYSLDGVFMKKWDCISIACSELKISRGGIENCVLDKSKSSGGFIWRYYDDVIPEIINPLITEKPGRKKNNII